MLHMVEAKLLDVPRQVNLLLTTNSTISAFSSHPDTTIVQRINGDDGRSATEHVSKSHAGGLHEAGNSSLVILLNTFRELASRYAFEASATSVDGHKLALLLVPVKLERERFAHPLLEIDRKNAAGNSNGRPPLLSQPMHHAA